MIAKKIIIGSLLSVCAANAGINVAGIEALEGSELFRDKVFNQEVKLPEGCVPLGTIFTEISKQTGYTVKNNTNLDEKAPVCNMDKFSTAGFALEAIVKDTNKIFYTNAGSGQIEDFIFISYADSYTAVFPDYWDVDKTARLLKEKYPFLKWNFYGRTVKVEGSEADVKKVVEKISELRDYAHREIPITVRVSRLNIDDTAKSEQTDVNFKSVNIINRMENRSGARIYNMIAAHGKQFHVSEVPVAIKLDFQKNKVIFGDKELDFDSLYNLAFMFNDYQITVDLGGLFDNSSHGN